MFYSNATLSDNTHCAWVLYDMPIGRYSDTEKACEETYFQVGYALTDSLYCTIIGGTWVRLGTLQYMVVWLADRQFTVYGSDLCSSLQNHQLPTKQKRK